MVHITCGLRLSQDPREYLPFLRELRSLEKYIQQFRINDHLRRHDRALKSLHLAGPDYFKDAVNYIERHQLYSSALSIWKNDEHYSVCFYSSHVDHSFNILFRMCL